MSYPVLSSHIGLSAKQLKLLGVSAATIRLSVGIEDAGDLIADLNRLWRGLGLHRFIRCYGNGNFSK